MFSYGTGGLHALPLHLVRFLWLPACLLFFVALMCECHLVHSPLCQLCLVLCHDFMPLLLHTTQNVASQGRSGVEPCDSCVRRVFPMHASLTRHPFTLTLWPLLWLLSCLAQCVYVCVYACCVVRDTHSHLKNLDISNSCQLESQLS